MNTGFVLRIHGWSTDLIAVLTIGIITTAWTILVIISDIFFGEQPCRQGLDQCLARMAYAPWIIQLLFFFWACAFADELLCIRYKEARRAMKLPQPLQDVEARSGLSDKGGNSVVATASHSSHPSHDDAPAHSKIAPLSRDTLRIILQTDHKEGTVYVLPCKGRGFDAVWSPKIEAEHAKVDAAVEQWREKGGYDQASMPNYQPYIAAFHSSSQLSVHDLTALTSWLYEPAANKAMCTMRCIRAPDTHLIGASVMLALRCAEYLCFMRRGRLPEHLQRRIGLIRSSRWSGADLSKDVVQIGSRPGLEGYQDAVRYIYTLFDQPVDDSALRPTVPPPKSSVVLDPCPATIDEYVAALWDHCREREPTTFGALHAFTYYWSADIGNGNGWHGIPLRYVDRKGDIVSWHVIWRQAWYLAIIAQLTSMSPIIFSAFVAGVLQ